MAKDPFKIRIPKQEPKKVIVLSKAEHDRLIRNSISNEDEKEEENAKMEERRKRQEATKALSKLVVQRKKPGSELRKQQYAQAIQSAHQELEQETRIEARRNYVLDLAYKRMFEQTDRVKNFQAAKNLAETLNQRDVQTKTKASMIGAFSKYETDFLLGMLRDIDSHREEENEKLEKVKRDKLKNAVNWKRQREEVERKKNQAEWEHLRDGYIVREAAATYAEEAKNAELRLKRKIREYKAELDKQREKKHLILEMYDQLDDADDKRAKVFNDAKLEMKIKHKEVKEALDKKKEQKRQYVATNLRDEISQIKAKEEAILQKAILQADAKYRNECAIKQANKEEALKSIQDFYEKEMESKAKREFEERRRGFQERRDISEHVDDLQQVENSKFQARKNLEKEAQHLQLHQIAKKRMDKTSEKLEDLKDYLNHMRSLEDEEEVFQKYAQMEIADFESRGIDTKTMQVAARPGIECGKGPLYKNRGQIRPKYYSSAAEGDELNHVKRDQNKPDSKSRLGFMLH